jgi:CRISPR/Cas system-associated exonuclease Cas4 (RecB family)
MFENVPDLKVTEVRRVIDEDMRPRFIDARVPIATAVVHGLDPG